MDQHHPGRWRAPHTLPYLALATAFTLAGCASPGPPRPPSLHLPQPVQNLTANRVANTIHLHVSVPSESTDKLPLRTQITGVVCRQVAHNPCVIVESSRRTIPPGIKGNDTTWTDTLPPSLTQGPPQLLTYRIEFFNPSNKTAGFSNPAFTASGPPPAPVQNLHAQGSRLGIVLSWAPSGSEDKVLLHREDLSPARARHTNEGSSRSRTADSESVWLAVPGSHADHVTQILDAGVHPDIEYRYTAQRRVTVQVEAHLIELRSDPSASVTYILRGIYPPPAPTGVTAAGYRAGTPSTFAVDLVWQPADDNGLITPLAGYNVYRQPIDRNGKPAAPRVKLNVNPVPSPAFHDTTANQAASYEYSVSAVDTNGNESSSASTLLTPVATNPEIGPTV